VTLGLGEDVTCTFVNDDNAPSLTLVKQVINDNGGTAPASAWTLTASGPTTISGAGGATSGTGFAAGMYTLTEAGPANYIASGWNCEGGTQSGNTISIDLGQSATCTVTNNDVQPLLTVIKNVVNDNGGVLSVSDFPLFVGNMQVVSGAATAIDAGSYVVSEQNQPGYSAGTWGGDCATDGSVELNVGDNKTCTITNNDLPPDLQIVKTALDPMTIPGADLAYSITVTNIGAGDALDVTLTDPLPPTQNPDQNLPPLPWTTTTEGCSILNDGALLTCDIGTLVKDPTPDQIESGDEASFTVIYSVTIPDDYLETEGDASGPGTLGSYFEIDGNLVDDNDSAALDWGSPELALVNVWDAPLADLSPDYVVDNAFSDGAKENDEVPTVVDHPIPPNKSDLTNFLIAEDEVDGNSFLALGWIRTDSLGTSNFDFELNQSVQMTANGVTPERTTGDVLFSFDFESSGNVVMLSLREWNGDTGKWGEPRSLNIEGTGYAAINDPLLFGTDPDSEINPFLGDAMPDQSFGEALINMTQTFQSNCRTFVHAFVKGRSSTPFTAVLKDFIAPIGVEIDTCRTIPLDNEATTDASNPGQDPVSDDSMATVSNDPVFTGDPDEDGVANYIDPDDDNDGIPDESDAFPSDPEEWADSDGDGVGDNGDAFPNDPTESSDSDGDGVGDNSDAFPNDALESTDSDGDGVGDNGDVFPDDPSEWADSDGDGVGDNADALPNDASETTDSDGDGVGDNGDVFPNDPTEWADTDGDGVGDNADAFPNDASETTDSDGDGVGDNSDVFPDDPSEWVDTDGDGVGDNGDAFPNDPTETADSDGDGVGDNTDAFPNIAGEWQDSDGDGVGDNSDPAPNDPSISADADGDGVGDSADAFPNDPTEWADTDGDGVGDNADAFPGDASETTDTDGDGVGDNSDVFPNDPSESADSDGDGVGDNGDAFPNDPSEIADSDGDGVGDNADAFPADASETADSDGDGVGDNGDAFPTDPTETTDTDGDGTGDNGDAFPADPSETTDTDGDGIGDNSDAFPGDSSESTDTDGDGVGDNSDVFPTDPTETTDTDSDGVGDNSDMFPTDPTESEDTDNDGVGDNGDAFPTDPTESADSDGDGIGDNADVDADNDGVDDTTDAFPTDPTETADTDGDGVGDNADAFPADPTETKDTDGDGIGDNEDLDADGDGIDDNNDAFPEDPSEWADSDGDGVGDNADAYPDDASEWSDSDGDGIGDNSDAFPNDASEWQDSDGDGVGDNSDMFPNDPTRSSNIAADGDGTAPEEIVVTASSSSGGGGAFDLFILTLQGSRRSWSTSRPTPLPPAHRENPVAMATSEDDGLLAPDLPDCRMSSVTRKSVTPA
jgi:uncharacterized repeat protein (TIGR01451 family)